MRILAIVIFSLICSGCNTRIAWENGKFTIDPFGGKYVPQQQQQQQQQNIQVPQQQQIIINNRPQQNSGGYSPTNPNHSMVQFNANRHSFGNL